MSFPHCKTYFTRIGHYLKTTIFKTLDSNYFTLSSMFSFQNAWPIKICLFIYLVRIGLDHNFLFLNLLFFKGLQVVRRIASVDIFYRFPSYKENTAY